MLADMARPLGVPPPWQEVMWPAFIQFVLKVLVEARDRLLRSKVCSLTWHENQFSAALLLHIWDIRDQGEAGVPFPFVPSDEARLLLIDVAQGTVHPDNCPRIDFAMRHSGMPRLQYFGIEAKVLTSVTVGTRKPGKSVNDYVNEGMKRFIDERYGAGMAVGAMLGFLLNGDHSTMASTITQEVKDQVLPTTEYLTLTTHPSCESHYYSTHPRRASSIKLHHLLFEMFPT